MRERQSHAHTSLSLHACTVIAASLRTADDAVAEVAGRVITLCRRRGIVTKPVDPSHCVFKVVGYADYLLHPHYPLRRYRHVVECARDPNMDLHLELLHLTPTQLRDVALLRGSHAAPSDVR